MTSLGMQLPTSGPPPFDRRMFQDQFRCVVCPSPCSGQRADTNDPPIYCSRCDAEFKAFLDSLSDETRQSAEREFDQAVRCEESGEFEQAVVLLVQSANNGCAKAQTKLGQHLTLARGMNYNASAAVSWYAKAAAQGDVSAIAYLSLCFARGFGVPMIQSQHSVLARIAANRGHMLALAWCLISGNGYLKDLTRAAEIARTLSEAGDADAQIRYATCLADGLGVKKNPELSYEWCLKSAEQGNVRAICFIGYCLKNGIGVPKDMDKALSAFLIAAEAGDLGALYNLGIAHEFGHGVPTDFSRAFDYYYQSAVRGHIDAQYAVGRCYALGMHVSLDDTKAVHWYLPAAMQGSASAQANLGVAYEEGRGVATDSRTAVYFYQLAADSGNAKAQYHLANCLEKGLGGIETDLEEAIRWYRKAAQQNRVQALQTATSSIHSR